MRVTGNRLIDLSAASTTKSQAQVATATAEVSSGMRVSKPSDDPTAWAAAQRATLRRTLAEGANTAVQASRDRLDETDNALDTIGDAVSQVRALAIQGASASYGPADRAAIAVHVRALFENARTAANTKSSDGEYIFAGSNSFTAPFDAAGTYTGDAVSRDVPTYESGTSRSTVPGTELTATAGVDVLPLMERVAAALAANDLPALQLGLGELETAIKQVALARTRTGGAMTVLDSAVAAHGELAEHLSTTIASQVEADSVGAATNLAKASQALERSRVVASHVISLLGSRST